MKISTLKELYDRSIKEYSKRPAFSIIGGESLTYNDFDARVKKFQGMLLGAGIRKGDKVAIYSRSLPSWPAAYFACVTLGIIAVPVLPDFTGEEVTKLLKHSEAKGLFVGSILKTRLPQEAIDSLNIAILLDTSEAICQTVQSDEEIAPEAPSKDDLAVIIYTSGTTSEPKGVMLTHYALAMQINMYPTFFKIDCEDRFLSILPLSHTLECSICMLYPFSVGASVTYLDRLPSAAALIPAFKSVRPTCFITVPLVLDKIYRAQIRGKIMAKKITGWAYTHIGLFRRIYHRLAGGVLAKTFGGCIRFIGIGGAKLSSDTDRFLNESGLPIAIGYGLTETAPLLFASSPGTGKIGSTGPAFNENIQYKIVDRDPQTGAGELLVKTPSLMTGYYKNEEATAKAIDAEGWFRTNDIVVEDSDRFISIVGRANNMIVGASGENIYPEEIENVLNTYPIVSESVVVMDNGVLVALVHYEKEKLEKAIAKLHTSREEAMERIHKAIIEHVNSRVNSFSRIKAVRDHFEEFEKTATQKIRRKKYQQ